MVESVERMTKLHNDLPKAREQLTADSLQLTALKDQGGMMSDERQEEAMNDEW